MPLKWMDWFLCFFFVLGGEFGCFLVHSSDALRIFMCWVDSDAQLDEGTVGKFSKTEGWVIST